MDFKNQEVILIFFKHFSKIPDEIYCCYIHNIITLSGHLTAKKSDIKEFDKLIMKKVVVLYG